MVGDKGRGSTDIRGSLVAQATAGDRVALEELLISHGTQLARHISRNLPPVLQSQVSVDDILQQVFVDVFRGIDSFVSRSEASFATWLRRIADSRLRDAIKKVTRERRVLHRCQPRGAVSGQGSSVAGLANLLAESGDSPSGSAARHEAVQAMHVGIAGLPPNQRDAVRLHVLQGMSLGETAAVMEQTTDAVRGLIYRAKRRLRAILRRSSLWLTKK